MIIFEGEKSCLKYQTYFGEKNDVSVACCGSNISGYQMHLLLEMGVKEIIIALDRQFKELGDEEFMKLKKNLLKSLKTTVTLVVLFACLHPMTLAEAKNLILIEHALARMSYLKPGIS